MVLVQHLLLTVLSLIIAKVAGQAFDIEMSDKAGEDENTLKMLEDGDTLLNNIKTNEADELKGFSGTIGIVGGSFEFVGATYFAGMTALKLGVDNVKILCDAETAEALKRMTQDISIYPVLNTMEKALGILEMVDVVILGPGLELNGNNRNSVIPKIINLCKTHKKPLIIDLNIWFWTREVVDMLAKFPESGVIVMASENEFTKIYQMMKKASNDTAIELDEAKFKSNIYILRKGIMDRGISMNKKVSWTSQFGNSVKPGNCQNYILTGAVGAFYFWANKHLTVTEAKKMGPMYQAGVATFTASTLTRYASRSTSASLTIFMTTSDILNRLQDKYYDIDSLNADMLF